MRRMLILGAVLLFASWPTFAETIDAGDGIRIWYTFAGNRRGTPIIVIHGGPGMDYNSLAADLKPLEKTYRLIYYDQRGGGRSTLPSDPAMLAIEHHVLDLEALRRSLNLDKVVLLAHSFGPAIAARYAMRFRDHVDRMIFLSPIPPRKGKFVEEYGAAMHQRLTAEQRKQSEDAQKRYDGPDVVAACREYWSINTPPRLSKSLPASVVKSDLCTASPEAIRYGARTTNAATFASLGEWDWTAGLAQVKAPTLIIHGEEDAIPMAMVSLWETALPNAQLMKLPNTGHFPHAERPAIVFPAIEKFLGSK